MGIEAATSSVTASATQTVGTTQSSAKTNSSDSSFKDEMTKVTESDAKKNTNTTDKDSKNVKSEQKSETNDKKVTFTEDKSEKKQTLENCETDKLSSLLQAQLSMNDANMMLSNDIQQMIENTVSVNGANLKNWSLGFGDNSSQSSLKMNESDADFFINLTKNENINIQSIQAQAQSMLNNGAEAADVKQNVQVSQTLLNALSQARENNQPLRIDFDQNISVILRVGRDGALSAQFIPGDKAVEQYLRNNIESLKASFDEQDLPYNELSYSHSSKDQNQRRREEKRQGE